jgi:hypothetical protein
MSENTNYKSKEKRLEEKERVEADAERSYAVAKMKKAHKLIEDVEKLRKHSALQSICERVDNHIQNVMSLGGVMHKSEDETPPTQGTVFGEAIESIIRIYNSIRYDIQKTLEMKDEDLERLFPKLQIKTTSDHLAVVGLLNMSDQLLDMRIYCERMLA